MRACMCVCVGGWVWVCVGVYVCVCVCVCVEGGGGGLEPWLTEVVPPHTHTTTKTEVRKIKTLTLDQMLRVQRMYSVAGSTHKAGGKQKQPAIGATWIHKVIPLHTHTRTHAHTHTPNTPQAPATREEGPEGETMNSPKAFAHDTATASYTPLR